MNNALSILTAFLCLAASAQEAGTIAGKLTDKEANGKPLPFANVLIKGTEKGTTSNFDGLYEISSIEPGTYVVQLSYVGYESKTIHDVKVKTGKVTEINTGLSADAAALDEVVINTVSRKNSEVALLIDQKKATEIKQAIGAEELSRKGVSNAEGAVKKVSGITKVNSRGVFVRGLDERYSFLTINDLPVSPVNWEAKIPSLQLFNSSVISQLDINKVFYPNNYGDFAGASINVKTKRIPSRSKTRVKLTAGTNLQSLDQQNFLTDKENGKQYYFGFGGADARQLPSEIKINDNTSAAPFKASGQDAVEAFDSDWNTENIKTPISTGLNISNEGVLNREENGDRTAYYVGMSFRNHYNSKIGNSFLKTPQGGLVRDIQRNDNFSYKTNTNALFSVFNKTENSYLNFNYLFFKTSDNSLSDNFGEFTGQSTNILGRGSKFTQSTLHQFQLLGSYDFNENSSLNYAATYGNSNYLRPDSNIATLEQLNDNNYVFASNSGRLYKYFLNSENDNFGGKLEYNLSIDNPKSEKQDKLTIGANLNSEGLDVYNNFILVRLQNTGRISIDPNDIDGSLTGNFSNGNARYEELLDTRYIDLRTDIYSGYANYNHHFNNKLSLSAGLRVEKFNRRIGKESMDEGAFEFDRIFILPNLNMRYSIDKRSNLRLAASKTYTKPKNIEIVDITRQNSLGDLIQGNPELKNSDNYNLDLKYEIFPNDQSLISVNLFGKYIDNPIERLVQNSGSYVQTIFKNTNQAYLYGAEFEAKTTLGDILGDSRYEDLSFGANVTLMDSKVSISNELKDELNLTNSSRKLQGASNFLLNADVSYNVDFSDNFQSQFTATFNTYSKRISRVGSGAATVKYDDEYEKPFNTLNFIWQNDFGDSFSTKLKLQNILNDTYKRTIEGNTEQLSNRSYQIGRSISLSLQYEI